MSKKRNKKPEVEDDTRALCSKIYPVIQPVDPIEEIPLGLELLINAEHLFIRPQEIPAEHFMPMEDAYHYDIIDVDSGRIYFAWETDIQGYGRHRSFTLKIVDFAGRPVLMIKKESNWLSCLLRFVNCFGTTGSTVYVTQPNGEKIGSLLQKYNRWTPKFLIRDELDKDTMTLMGPSGENCCYNCNMSSSMMLDATFPLLTLDGDQLGCIAKGSPDPMENVETFRLRFPLDISVQQKATLIGAVFAINFMFFERPGFDPDAIDIYEQRKEERLRQHRVHQHQRDLDALGLNEDGLPKTEGALSASVSAIFPTTTLAAMSAQHIGDKTNTK